MSERCAVFAGLSRAGSTRVLRGPTGERNLYSLHAREAVLGLAADDTDLLVQLAAVLAVGSRALWPSDAATLRARLPLPVQEEIALAADWAAPTVCFDAVIHHGSADELRAICGRLAARAGPIVGVEALRPGETAIALERLVSSARSASTPRPRAATRR